MANGGAECAAEVCVCVCGGIVLALTVKCKNASFVFS